MFVSVAALPATAFASSPSQGAGGLPDSASVLSAGQLPTFVPPRLTLLSFLIRRLCLAFAIAVCSKHVALARSSHCLERNFCLVTQGLTPARC
jgi:hypothetical protein